MFPIKLLAVTIFLTVPYCYGVTDYAAIHEKCNTAYGVSMDALTQLNHTGIFPAEHDTNQSWCYVKCWFENVGILTDDKIWNKDKVAEHLWPNAIDSVDPCLAELKEPMEICLLSYKLINCMIKLRNVAWGVA